MIKRGYPTDATRPRRYSADKAKKAYYAKHRMTRFAARQANA